MNIERKFFTSYFLNEKVLCKVDEIENSDNKNAVSSEINNWFILIE